jgi:hypothetical protein
MTRVALCGGDELRATCAALDLEIVDSGPRLVLVDLRDPDAASRAAGYAAGLPRIAVVRPDQQACLAAIAAPGVFLAESAEPAVIGPLVRAAAPRDGRQRTRVVTITAARGGTGRTLCVANLARRVARDRAVVTIDATGTGLLGWWLAAEARPWAELEALAGELRPEHLELVASTASARLSVVGGAPAAPSTAILLAAVTAAMELAELVLVDAPILADERARACAARSDRVLVFAYADAASRAALAESEPSTDAWIIASQQPIDGAFRVLPRDEPAIADALAERRAVGGRLGRAYDELAELLSIDAT